MNPHSLGTLSLHQVVESNTPRLRVVGGQARLGILIPGSNLLYYGLASSMEQSKGGLDAGGWPR
ncbi:hypothetical protein KFK09_013209 [Dendrobium nobile]|uniref:Uncharacterized protein n=1 Tax=Dendrobium nobile TaxID=94219 RepID=A0A8T3B887_DENNO|nr:hypothetical protein KFK09_013209 [Dendrobium nobile]